MVADVAWGDGGKLDGRRCVSGSSTAEQQPASGSAKPTSGKGGRGAGAGAARDSAAGVWGYGAAVDGFQGGVDISGSSGGGGGGGGGGITGAVFMWKWRFFWHWRIGWDSGVVLFDMRIWCKGLRT